MSTKAESWRFTTMGMGIPGQAATCTNSELWKSRSYKQQIAQDGKSKVHVSGNIREEGERWLRDPQKGLHYLFFSGGVCIKEFK